MKWARGSFFCRWVSLSISIVFFSTNLDTVYALDANAVQANASETGVSTGSSNLSSLSIPQKISYNHIFIPQSLGLLKDAQDGKVNRLVIHIQDAHTHFEAQKKISEMIRSLVSQYWVSLVCVEGAQGPIDIGAYRNIADKKLNQRVAEYLMKQGILTGPEYLAITTDQPFKFSGAEKSDLHAQNLEEFREAMKAGKGVREFLTQVNDVVIGLKQEHYSQELLEFDKKLTDYHEKGINANGYFQELKAYGEKLGLGLQGMPNLSALIQAQQIETKIDYDQVDQERNQLVQKLSQALPKEELQKLVRKTLLLKLGRMTVFEYYADLEGMIGQAGGQAFLDKHPNFQNYLTYIKVFPKKPEAIFQEAELLEALIKQKLLRTDSEKILDQLSKNLWTLSNFLNLTLTSKDLDYYNQHELEIRPGAIQETLEKFGEVESLSQGDFTKGSRLSSEWNEAMDKSEIFYRTARQRDRILVEDVLRQMDEEQTAAAILVSGGFHTDGMIEEFKNRGVSFMVVTPNLTSVPDHELYLSRVMQEGLPLKELMNVLYQFGARGAIYLPLFSSDPKSFGFYLLNLFASIPGNFDVLEFPDFTLNKTQEAVDESHDQVTFWVVSKKDGVKTELGKASVKKEGSTQTIESWSFIKPLDELRNFLRQVIRDKPIGRETALETGSDKGRATVESGETSKKESGILKRLLQAAKDNLFLRGASATGAGGKEDTMKQFGPVHFQATVKTTSKYYAGVSNRNGKTDSQEIKRNVQVNQGTKKIKLSKYGITLLVDGREIDGKKLTDAQVGALLENALSKLKEADRDSLISSLRGKTLSVALLDQSPNLFENHLADGLIAVNRAVLDLAPRERDIALQVGIIHELRHESLGTVFNHALIGTQLVESDVQLTRALLEENLDVQHVEDYAAGLDQIVESSPYLDQLKEFAAGVKTPAGQGAVAVRKAFDAYYAQFNAITRRAQERFEKREWQGSIADGKKRIRLYRKAINTIESQIRGILGDRVQDPAAWAEMREKFLESIRFRYDADLALTFFYSAQRRIFLKLGIPVEYSDDGVAAESPIKAGRPYRVYTDWLTTQDLIKNILRDAPFNVNYENLDRDSKLAADLLDKDLKRLLPGQKIDSVEILGPVFYRNKGAYIAGRIRSGDKTIPLAIPLLNDKSGLTVDAVLTDINDISRIFSYTRSNFHADVDGNYREVLDFLETIMTNKGRAALYSSIGFIHPSKLELIRDLRGFLERGGEGFERAEGIEGRVMKVFAPPGFNYVFKIIMDQSMKSTFQGRDHVISQYQKVHEIDRVGRMLDTHVYTHLRFKKSIFPPSYLEELLRDAPSSVTLDGEDVILKHVYAQRRVTPLNLYLERVKDPEELKRIVADFGDCIKDLAAAGMFAADVFTKNFGVTHYGRVVLYDYDDLMGLDELQFRYKRDYAPQSNISPLDALFNQMEQIERREREGNVTLTGEREQFVRDVIGILERRHSRFTPFSDFEIAKAELRSLWANAFQSEMAPENEDGTPTFYVPNNMIFLDELDYFSSLSGPLKEYFRKVHSDLFNSSFWKGLQERMKRDEILDIYPYPQNRRLHVEAISLEKEKELLVQILMPETVQKLLDLNEDIFDAETAQREELKYRSENLSNRLRRRGFHSQELLYLGLLHQVRAEALRQIKMQYPNLITGLRTKILSKYTKSALQNFLTKFTKAFQNLSLREKTESGDIENLNAVLEAVLVRHIESKNDELRNHPLLKSPFDEDSEFLALGKIIEEYFEDSNIKRQMLVLGSFAGRQISLGLLEFSNGMDIKKMSIADQLKNARALGFNFWGLNPETLNVRKDQGIPYITVTEGRAAVNPKSWLHWELGALVGAQSPHDAAESEVQEFLGKVTESIRQGEATVTLDADGLKLSTQTQGFQAGNNGAQKQSLPHQFLKNIFKELGLEKFQMAYQEGVSDQEVVDLVNWLTLAMTVVRRDWFLGMGEKKDGRKIAAIAEWQAQLRRKLADRQREQTAKETNVKAITLDQIQNDFIDARTRNLIQQELLSGIKYVIVAKKGESTTRSMEKLACSNFDMTWIEKGQVVVLDALEVAEDTRTLDVDALIRQMTAKLGLDERTFKSYLTDPQDEAEQTNFVLAVSDKIDLTGRKDNVRYFRAARGMRMSEILTLLNGLLTAPLRVVVQQMKDYLLANGFTPEDLEELMQMEGDLLIPPLQTGNLVNQLMEEKKAAELISWAA